MKRLQVVFTDEAWIHVDAIYKQALTDVDSISINYSDVVNEMVQNSKIDVKSFQAKHIDLRKSLKAFVSQKEIDVDQLLKTLNDFKGKTVKRKSNAQSQEVKNV